jgi:hypothetical protein
MDMSGCTYQVNVFEAREEMRMEVFQALLWYPSTTTVHCVVTDKKQTYEKDLGFRLYYLSVIISCLFLNRGSHLTATMMPRNIHLYKIFLTVSTSTTVGPF